MEPEHENNREERELQDARRAVLQTTIVDATKRRLTNDDQITIKERIEDIVKWDHKNGLPIGIWLLKLKEDVGKQIATDVAGNAGLYLHTVPIYIRAAEAFWAVSNGMKLLNMESSLPDLPTNFSYYLQFTNELKKHPRLCAGIYIAVNQKNGNAIGQTAIKNDIRKLKQRMKGLSDQDIEKMSNQEMMNLIEGALGKTSSSNLDMHDDKSEEEKLTTPEPKHPENIQENSENLQTFSEEKPRENSAENFQEISHEKKPMDIEPELPRSEEKLQHEVFQVEKPKVQLEDSVQLGRKSSQVSQAEVESDDDLLSSIQEFEDNPEPEQKIQVETVDEFEIEEMSQLEKPSSENPESDPKISENAENAENEENYSEDPQTSLETTIKEVNQRKFTQADRKMIQDKIAVMVTNDPRFDGLRIGLWIWKLGEDLGKDLAFTVAGTAGIPTRTIQEYLRSVEGYLATRSGLIQLGLKSEIYKLPNASSFYKLFNRKYLLHPRLCASLFHYVSIQGQITWTKLKKGMNLIKDGFMKTPDEYMKNMSNNDILNLFNNPNQLENFVNENLSENEYIEEADDGNVVQDLNQGFDSGSDFEEESKTEELKKSMEGSESDFDEVSSPKPKTKRMGMPGNFQLNFQEEYQLLEATVDEVSKAKLTKKDIKSVKAKIQEMVETDPRYNGLRIGLWIWKLKKDFDKSTAFETSISAGVASSKVPQYLRAVETYFATRIGFLELGLKDYLTEIPTFYSLFLEFDQRFRTHPRLSAATFHVIKQRHNGNLSYVLLQECTRRLKEKLKKLPDKKLTSMTNEKILKFVEKTLKFSASSSDSSSEDEARDVKKRKAETEIVPKIVPKDDVNMSNVSNLTSVEILTLFCQAGKQNFSTEKEKLIFLGKKLRLEMSDIDAVMKDQGIDRVDGFKMDKMDSSQVKMEDAMRMDDQKDAQLNLNVA
eukprot:TRINITY_DN6333_c0_g1_i1.p1 TRINITY_DN6333_c0_g1~~TRINITY_DN6333_c0_g1_i1.p1  ORF type:complete len:942 (-),score=411.26 TRINITY_DN6333_c0_g1_i1:95-2920(-)